MSYSRSKFYSVYFVGIVLFMLYFIFIFGESINMWSSLFAILIVVVLFITVAIPVTIHTSDWLDNIIKQRKFHEKVFFKWLIPFIIIIPISLFSLTLFNEYYENREKNLLTLLSFEAEDVRSIQFGHYPDAPIIEENTLASRELLSFLAQYDVKKMPDQQWDSDVSKEKGFQLTVYTKNDELYIAHIYETRMLYVSDGNYYSVTNGPIDVDWVHNFADQY